MENRKKGIAAFVSAAALALAMFFGASRVSSETSFPKIEGKKEAFIESVESKKEHNAPENVIIYSSIKKQREAKRSQFLSRVKSGSLLAGVLGIIGLLRIGLTRICYLMGGLLGGIPGKVINFAGGVLLNFLLLCALMAFFFKLLYPEKSLKELFTLRNVLYIFIASLTLNTLWAILGLLSEKAYIIGEIIHSITSCLVILRLWNKLFNGEAPFGTLLRSIFSGKTGMRALLGMIFGCFACGGIRITLRYSAFLVGYAQSISAALLIILALTIIYQVKKPKKTIIILNGDADI